MVSSAIACNLKTCSDIKQVNVIHNHIVRNGLDSNADVECALIHIYGKLGGVWEARGVFDRAVSRQDVAMWNALISGYADHGYNLLALSLFQKMRSDGFRPSHVTFLIVIKACSTTDVIAQGRLLHAEIVREGLHLDVIIGSALIDMYAKSGLLEDALRAFEQLPIKNVVSWGAIMAGYVQHGLGKPAINLFTRMGEENIKPTEVIFSCVLKACGTCGDLDQGRVVHELVRKSEFSSNAIIGNALVDMYAKCGSLEEAYTVFNQLLSRTEVSWGTIIAGHVQHGQCLHALVLFVKMQDAGKKVNTVIFSSALKACSGLEFPGLGRVLHTQIVESHLETDKVIGNNLIGFYCSFGDTLTASSMFNSLPKKNLGSWEDMIVGYAKDGQHYDALELFIKSQEQNVGASEIVLSCILNACAGIGAIMQARMIHEQVIRRDYMSNIIIANSLVDVYIKCGSLEEAQNTFEKFLCRDTISWNTIIGGCIQAGHGFLAVDLFHKMLREGKSKPDRVTFIWLLKACQYLGIVAQGRFIHKQIVMNDFVLDMEVGSLLVSMYGNCGSLEDAWKTFGGLPSHDTILWSALIGGYVQHGYWDLARKCLEDMQEEGLSPDATTFTIILANCSQIGDVQEGYKLFQMMITNHGISPTIEHFNCMVDLLSRAGCLHEAFKLLLTMPASSDIEGWMSLLVACRSHGEVVMGRVCFDRIVYIDSVNSSAFTLMLQIYAEAHMMEEFHNIEGRKKSTSVEKICKCLDLMSDKLNEFVVLDQGNAHLKVVDVRLKVVL